MKHLLARLAFVLLATSTGGYCADAPKFGLASDNKIYAQAIVRQVIADNPALLTAGLHCVPPGESGQKIIASTLDVIGKPSDPEDIQVGVEGVTHIYPNLKVPKLGVMLPLHDRSGNLIGALALAFKYRAGEDQVKYFAAATAIREQVAERISSLSALFAAAP